MSVNQIKLAGEKRVKWELPSRVELLQHPSIDPVPSLPVVYAQTTLPQRKLTSTFQQRLAGTGPHSFVLLLHLVYQSFSDKKA